MCGLPGTGKSWLARELARPLLGRMHRSDVRRKRLASAHQTNGSFGEGNYTSAMREHTYRDLLDVSLRDLRSGQTAVVDATFSGRLRRRVFIDAAARLELPWFLVHVEAPEELVRSRLEHRAHESREASDADLGIYLRAREEFDDPNELPVDRVLRVTSGAETPAAAAERLLDRMLLAD